MDVIEIRDPKLKRDDILARIADQIAGKTVPDFSTIGPESLQNSQTAVAQTAEANSLAHETLLDLMMLHQLEEPSFTSETPLVGPWIVRLRELWNWMSTKWYVRPIMRQQSTINGQMVLLLMEQEAILKEQQQAIAHLEEKVNHLESVIASEETTPTGVDHHE